MILEDLQRKLRQRNIQAYMQTMNNMFLGQDVLKKENKI